MTEETDVHSVSLLLISPGQWMGDEGKIRERWLILRSVKKVGHGVELLVGWTSPVPYGANAQATNNTAAQAPRIDCSTDTFKLGQKWLRGPERVLIDSISS